MRISIPMLADALPSYKPDARVLSGGRTLRNARLLSDSQAHSRSTLYLQQNSPDTVACVNGNDVLFLHSDDADRCLNDVLDVFDLYEEWADEVEGLIADGSTLHGVLELIARKADMHLVVADATYLIHERAEGATRFDNPNATSFLESRSMPLDMILRIDEDPKVRSADAGVYYVRIDEENTSAVCNLFVDGEHRGWLVANRNGSRYTLGDFDFLEAAKGMLERWMRECQGSDERWEQTAVLRQLAEGAFPDEALVQRALAVFGWNEGDSLRVYAMQPDALSMRPIQVAQRFLAQAMPHSFSVRMDKGLMIVANESLPGAQGRHDEIVQVLESCGFRAGQSPAFTDIMGLASFYGAACVAASVADTKNPLVAFEDVKLPYALSVLRLNSVADVRHGALDMLVAYDQTHGTQLYETLRRFVENRGSYARTYEQLFIHRSTLQYRLERIAEICGLDFESPSTWAHLQLSFLLDERA